MSDDAASEEYEEDFRVVNPDTGACVFQLGDPWPQPDVHANLVRALFALEQAKDPDMPIPSEFGDNRAKWTNTIEERIMKLRQAVAAKVEEGEQQPTYAIVDAIKVDGDRIMVVGRSIGRWKDMPDKKQKGVSCDLPYSKFAIETRWVGKNLLAEFLAELEEEDDDEEETTTETKPARPAAAQPAPRADVCAGCGAGLAGAPFCSKCGTPRSDA